MLLEDLRIFKSQLWTPTSRLIEEEQDKYMA